MYPDGDYEYKRISEDRIMHGDEYTPNWFIDMEAKMDQWEREEREEENKKGEKGDGLQ